MSGGDLNLIARGHQISSARAQSELRMPTKVEAQGFGLGSGEREPPISRSLTQGRDQRYEVTIGTLEAGDDGGTSWLGVGQKRNSRGRISHARTTIEAMSPVGACADVTVDWRIGVMAERGEKGKGWFVA
ncbi:hypothetical protein TIFTF001_007255 [Ficus carica]|uniref:Uncharacterized protein n=1 Tax=Ficus carica TaxID=3494 RepID=A0AA87ZT24_FICCA|nr:hypothetical protein TIFTF001_007255 [Ficus carica]